MAGGGNGASTAMVSEALAGGAPEPRRGSFTPLPSHSGGSCGSCCPAVRWVWSEDQHYGVRCLPFLLLPSPPSSSPHSGGRCGGCCPGHTMGVGRGSASQRGRAVSTRWTGQRWLSVCTSGVECTRLWCGGYVPQVRGMVEVWAKRLRWRVMKFYYMYCMY